MRLNARRFLFFAVPLFLASCEGAALDPSESLVGANELPFASKLSRETIQIYFGYDKDLANVLSFELRPDDSWTVRIAKPQDSSRFRSQKFQLTPAHARSVREKLWRVRPAELKGIEWLIEPADCPPPPTDTSYILSVLFIAEGPKPGVEDDKLALFALPEAYTCNTRQAIAARELLEEVLKPLPGSNLRSRYRFNPPLG